MVKRILLKPLKYSIDCIEKYINNNKINMHTCCKKVSNRIVQPAH